MVQAGASEDKAAAKELHLHPKVCWKKLTKQIESRLESTGTSPEIRNLNVGFWTLDFFYGLWMTQGYQLDHSLSQRLLKYFFDNVLLEHVGLIRVLPLAVHLFFLC